MAYAKKDLGIVTFSKLKGKRWAEVPGHWLEFIVSDDCLTCLANKETARKEQLNRLTVEGQEELFEEI